jgi:uncharacterized protein (UPF0248 family)
MTKEVEQALSRLSECARCSDDERALDTIRQALTSNVSEDEIIVRCSSCGMITILTSNGYECVNTMCSTKTVHPQFITVDGIQSPQSLEELKQDIIDELNEFGGYENVYFDDIYGLRCVTLYTDMSVPMHRLLKENIKLAHKITTYFMRLEEER